MTDGSCKLASGRSLARNAVWNLSGMVAPMFVALIAIPFLIESMGKERFGLLTLIWMGVGYFSFFDLGLSRALTKLVADRLSTGCLDELGSLIWTAISLLLGLGVFASLIIWSIAPAIVQQVLQVDPDFYKEAIIAFRLLAVGIPIVVFTSALIGILEAHQRFAIITVVRTPLGALTFIGPLLVLQFTKNIAWVTSSLLASRVIAAIAFFAAASFVRSELRAPVAPLRRHIRPLLGFGGWLTITNIVGPMLTYLDRFLVGAILSMTAVAYYATPYDVMARIQILPQAIMGVLFPAMASAHATHQVRLVTLYSQSNRVLLILMLPVISFLFFLSPEILCLWISEDFSIAATPAVKWLAVGWIINVMARPAFTVLQSAGRPDLVAKTHLSELIPYVILLWFATHKFGISGTAAAWSLRVLVDMVILNALSKRLLPQLAPTIWRTYLTVIFLLFFFAGGAMLEALAIRVVVLLGTAISCAIIFFPFVKKMFRDRKHGSIEGFNSKKKLLLSK